MSTSSPANLQTCPGTRILFLDMAEVEELEGVVQTVTEAEKSPLNPVLPAGDLHEWDSAQARPWESRTVLYDDEDHLFKCWYAGADLTPERRWRGGYATSRDGVRWTKPKLGLYEYNGSKQNNICFPDWWGPVIKEVPEENPTRRYRMIVQPHSGGFFTGYSADGIHWEKGGELDLKGLGHPVALVKDEDGPDPARRYLLFGQVADKLTKKKPGLDKESVRAKCLACSPDGLHWTFSTANPVLTPNDSREHENHFLMLIPYHGYYIMLYEYGWYVPNGYGIFGSYCADVRLAISRDGEHYQRILPHQPIIRRGRVGEWDDGFLCIADKAVIKDDTIYLYYCGQGQDWTSWPGENWAKEDRLVGSSGCIRLSRMGLATLRLDGFTSLGTEDGEMPGYMVTCPIQVVDPSKVQLRVNVGDTIPRRSWIEVEVLDAGTREPLDGFSRNDCQPVDEEGLRLPVRWGEEQGLAGVKASRIALRFWFYGGARLYSFAFESL